MRFERRSLLFAASAAVLVLACAPAQAAKMYGPGASDTEIKIGNTMPYSGPASAYGAIGHAIAAYFAMINDEGGVNGRKINFVSLDDGYSPPKTVEQTRRLVEQDKVLLVFQGLGTPTSTAVHQYLNDQKVPQLFLATGATKWNDPKHFPWTMGWQPSYQVEGRIYAHYILKNMPNAKIGILMQNDDYGKDYVKGMLDGLGDKAKMVVATKTYETSDPTVDSQIVALKASGADVFFNVTTPKFASQAIRKAYDIGWKATQFLNNVSTSVSAVLQPAGLDKSVGIISSYYLKDPADPKWKDTKEYKDWLAWMKKYLPNGNLGDVFNVYGYTVAQNMVYVLKQCGDDLTRENVMKQAASIKGLELPMLLPGIKISTGPDDFAPIKQMQLMKFDGKSWELFGDVLSAEGS